MSIDSGPIKEAIDSFTGQTTEIVLPIGLDDNNTKEFLDALFYKVEKSAKGINQLLNLKFKGDLSSTQQQILAECLEDAIKNKFVDIYGQASDQEYSKNKKIKK